MHHMNMKNGNEPDEAAQRVPQPGTIAYAQWKRRQEVLSSHTGKQETVNPSFHPSVQTSGQEPLNPLVQVGELEGKTTDSQPDVKEGVRAHPQPSARPPAAKAAHELLAGS